jgi:sugar-specific transcriptional regulator TrmB
MQMLDYKKMVGKRFITMPSLPQASLEEDAQKITQFGLTHNQAKIYLAVLKLGTTQIEPISRISSVRREDIYRILPRLYELGIIERVVGSPTRVKAIPIGQAIRILARSRQEALSRESSELMYRVEDFLEYFNPAKNAPPEEDDGEQFSIAEGKFAVEGKIAGLLERARKEVLVASGTGTFTPLSGLPGILESVPDRGLSIRIITEQSELLTLSAILKGLKSRNLDFRLGGPGRNAGNFLVADGREAVIITSEDPSARCSSLWTNNACLISLLRENFESTWSAARVGSRDLAPAEERPDPRTASTGSGP